MKTLFNDHRVCKDNTVVAELEVNILLKQAQPQIKLTRVSKVTDNFERAVLHLTQTELDSLFTETKKNNHSFLALQVTTKAGLTTPHRAEKNPTRVVLAVRRMDALSDPSAWKAFLLATESDCIAIAENRLGDVSESAKPMLSLFLEHSEILPALKILSVAFLEIHRRKIGGESFLRVRAAESEKADWWQRVLDVSIFEIENESKTYLASWKDLRVKDQDKAISLLMDKIYQEALRRDSNAEKKLQYLIHAISSGGDITNELVKNASDGLDEIMK